MENMHEAQGSHRQGPTQNLQALRMFRHRKGLGSQNQDFQKHLASAKEWRNEESSTERIHFHWSRLGRSKDSWAVFLMAFFGSFLHLTLYYGLLSSCLKA